MKTGISKITLGAIAGLMALGAISAKAISYSLNDPNAALAGYAGPYGFVDVTLTDSTHAVITFTGNTVGNYQYLFGGVSMADVNLNSSSFNVTVVAPSTTKSPILSGNVSSFGNFNITIDNKNASDTTDTVKFNVEDLSGSWANASSVLIANADTFIAAAHIVVVDTTTGGVAITGFTANADTTHVVPDGGSTMALLGAGLLGLGCIRRKMAKKN